MSAVKLPDGGTEVKPTSYPEMLTIRQVVSRTDGNLSYSGVRRLCLENRIVHIRIGAKYLINWQKLCEFLDGEV